MENIFSQFIDKYLEIEEVEYLIHYIKFKMWPALFYVNTLCFPNIFESLLLGCTLFSPIYTEIDNWDYECWFWLDVSIFPIMKEIKNWSRPCLVSDSLIDQSMLFTHLYLMQGEKIEAWFVSQASREYFGVESTAFLSANKFTKNLSTGKMNC